MSCVPSEFDELLPLLPSSELGDVFAIERISKGLSGAQVFGVRASRGEFVLRLRPGEDPRLHQHRLAVQQLVAQHGLGPRVVYVDQAASAVVSVRAPGLPLDAVLADPQQRDAAVLSVVMQMRALHQLDASQFGDANQAPYARAMWEAQRRRVGFPGWAGALSGLLNRVDELLARDRRRVLSHNDPNFANILWDGTRALFVDWDISGRNHPFYDLAALSALLQLDSEIVNALLALQEQRAVSAEERVTFDVLRALAGLFWALVMLSTVPDLTALPERAPTLDEVYAGRVQGAQAEGRGLIALALLRGAVEGCSELPAWQSTTSPVT